MRQFSAGETISKSFKIFGENILGIAFWGAIFSVPAAFQIFEMRKFSEELGKSPGSPPDLSMERLVPIIGLSILSMIALTLFSGAVAHGVQGHIRGRRFDWSAGILASYRRVLTLIVVGVLLAIAQALCCCCIGAFLLVIWYATVPVAVVERVGVFKALGRSNQLTEGFRMPVFGVFLVAILLLHGAPMVAGPVIYVDPRAGMILQWVIHIFAYSYAAVSQSVTYYELRSAKEGVDLEDLEDVF